MESLQQVVPFGFRDGGQVGLPAVGIELTGAVLVEPVDLLGTQQEYAPQYQFRDHLGVGLGIGEGEGAAPGAAKNQPAFDAQFPAQLFHVGDQVPGGVGLQ